MSQKVLFLPCFFLAKHLRFGKNYTARNTMFNAGQGAGAFQDAEYHPAGRLVYPFKYQLPPNTCIPSSFEGKHGKVHYWLECLILRPWSVDFRVVKPFLVAAVVVLNQHAPARVRAASLQRHCHS